MSPALALHRILARTAHATGGRGPALVSPLGPAPSCSVDRPWISHPNGDAAVTLPTAHRRHFSATAPQGKKFIWNPKKERKEKPPIRRPYTWMLPPLNTEDGDLVHDRLKHHILDRSRRVAQDFPVAPETPESEAGAEADTPNALDPNRDEFRKPPSLDDPGYSHNGKLWDAVVIDCQTVTMEGGEPGLLKIGAIDLFTGEVVLNNLVQPSAPVTDWRKAVTGFNKAMFNNAVKQGKVLKGWREVREKLFEVTTVNTIYVGHNLGPNLALLRIWPDRIIDSMLVLARAVFGDEKEKWPHWTDLQLECLAVMDLKVHRTRGPRVPIEDAFAMRELVLHCVRNPEMLQEWAATRLEAHRVDEETKDETLAAQAQKKILRAQNRKRAKQAAKEAWDSLSPEEQASINESKMKPIGQTSMMLVRNGKFLRKEPSAPKKHHWRP
ncbi:hypothetical protein F4808DRAFT_270960 [Astrocystis sublimbata]|nr:hypothetical protein F4808DRAFT_270960 [Astrocystis sublimbata]